MNLTLNCTNGYVHSNGYMNNQGTATQPSNNQWFNSFTCHTKNIVGTGSSFGGGLNRFLVQSSSGTYNPSVYNSCVTGGDASYEIQKQLVISGTTSGIDCSQLGIIGGPDNDQVARGIALDTVTYYGSDSLVIREFSRLSLYRSLRYDTIYLIDSLFQAFKDSMDLTAYFVLDSMVRIDTALVFPYEKDIIDSLLTVLDELVPTDTLQALYKEVLAIAVEHVWSGDSSWNESDVIRLREIAESCPFFYGDGVFLARSILPIMDTSLVIYFNECELPVEPSERRGEEAITADQDPAKKLRIYPNPSAGSFVIECLLSADEQAYLVIYDNIGREVFRSKPSCNGPPILVSGLSEGLYECVLLTNGKVELAEKLSIIRP